MPLFLRQSTASQEVPLGYFVDSTDGNTEETGLTIANTDIKVWKTGATTLANKNSGGGTHIANGVYYAVLDATDTDTIGPLVIFVHVSGALTVRVECCVLDEAMYDWLFGTAAPLAPTTAGRTLDVSAGGEAGIDWANVGSPTTTVGLSGTTVKTATDVETDTADIQARLPAALGANGNIKADVRDYNGTAGTFASGRPEVNTTHWKGTAAATVDSAGYPVVTVKDGTGQGEIGLTSGAVDTVTTLTNAPSDSAGVTTLLSRIPAALFSGITSLAQWLGLLAGKQTGNSTARTEVRATGAGSGTFDETTDSLEAVRDNVGTAGAGLTAADDAVITAIGALNNLSQANVRTAVGLASANLDTQLDALPTNAELATALGTADDATLAAIAALNNISVAQVNAEVDTALADVGLTTTITGRIDAAVSTRATPAQVNAEVVDGLTVDVVADSVPADGSRPTIAQAAYILVQFLTEFAISGTTLIVKKPDGSTTLMTFTLDSATTPTSITRAS